MKMNKPAGKNPARICREESGQALVMVLVLLMVGSLILSPVLSLINTSLKNGRVYDLKTNENYAAKSGIENATWQIRNGRLNTLLHDPDYNPYDYGTVWSYTLDEPINNLMTDVSIQNVWIPKDLAVPGHGEAQSIIESNKLIITGDTIQTGITLPDSSKISQYQVKVTYYPKASENLTVASFGIWLPRGFEYYSDSTHLSSLEGRPISGHPVSVTTSPWAGNQAVIWSYGSPPCFSDFPVQGTLPVTSNVTFYIKPLDQTQPNIKPCAVPWITTANGMAYGIPYAWDADIKVYKVTSVAGGTTVESYFAKSELRQMQAAIAGDYYATGNSALSDTDGDKNRETWHDPSTAAVTGSNIPQDADVSYAYLYWSGWKSDAATTVIKTDPCNNFSYWPWTGGSRWTVSSGMFKATGIAGGTTASRTLTANSNLDLSGYTSGKVMVSMTLTKDGTLENTDALYYAISNNAGVSGSWTGDIEIFHGNDPPGSFTFQVPASYLTARFRIRFYQTLDETNEYINLDNITVNTMLPDTSVVLKIDDGTGFKQVYLDTNGNPQQGSQELSASKTQVSRNYAGTSPHGYSYSSFRDVTALVRKYSEAPVLPAANWPGYATYSVGGIYASTPRDGQPEDEWVYANWSLIIIYTSEATQGHQLYLFDSFIYSGQDTQNGVNVDFDGDGKPGGYISGFIVPNPVDGEVNAAKITSYIGEGDVWYNGDYIAINGVPLWDGTATSGNSKSSPSNIFNSTSLGLGSYDGIDIDTLGIDPPNGQYITWASNVLKPGDTSAQVDMVTHTDVWNVIYIILSFRSKTTIGGILSYRIVS
jgi:hypothetical protein